MKVPYAAIMSGSVAVRMPSDSGGDDHLVRFVPGMGWTCSNCPDHQYRHHACKHITRLRTRLAEWKAAEEIRT